MNSPSDIANITKEHRPTMEAQIKILSRLNENTGGFHTLYSLLDETIWKSPTALAETWIQRVAKDEYEELLAIDQDYEVNQIKARTRKDILRATTGELIQYYEEQSFLRRMIIKGIVADTLANKLPPNDQDGIIAAELGIPPNVWQSMLGLFSNNPDFLPILRLPDTNIVKHTNPSGKIEYTLVTPECEPEKLLPFQTIPGIEIGKYVYTGTEIDDSTGITLSHFHIEVPALAISEDVLKRYAGMTVKMEKERTEIRNIIHLQFGGIPVWKRRFGRDENN
ncbi:MAG: hypothetical protein PHQ95_02715 [Candidatus Gracilibacteria bacterium]|nr:hypothetical protein [Candidatus Gracilibacteria bacterium]